MPSIAPFFPGSRAYGRFAFTRSAYETDTCVGTTATLTLVDADLTEVVVAPVVTNTATTVQVDWEYTLPAAAVPGVWHAVVQTATALIAHDEAPFRVLRAVT